MHTFMCLVPPPTRARTRWMFGFQRLRVRMCECDTFIPNPGPRPHTSQLAAMSPRMIAGDWCRDNLLHGEETFEKKFEGRR